MRLVFCSRDNRLIRGHGTTRVMRKLVFHFCARCWRNREDCEAHMRRVAGIAPDPTQQEVADLARAKVLARAAASAAVCALPESLARCLDDLPAGEVA